MIVEYTEKNGKVTKKKLISIEPKDLKDGNKVKIPDGITIIGRDALNFIRQENIEKLEIQMPDTVTMIEEYSFAYLNISQLRLSKNLRGIGRDAFSKTTFIKKIKMPGQVLKIPPFCFSNATFLNGIELPEQLEDIGYGAFTNTNINELEIPNGVRTLECEVFKSSLIKKVKLPARLLKIDEEAFSSTKQLKEIEIPQSVKEIGSFAFENSGLEKVLLHDGIKKLGRRTFANTQIEQIALPETIQNIGTECFFGCLNLVDVTFAPALKYIGDSAFQKCSLEEVILPDCVVIGSKTFLDNNLIRVKLSKDEFKQIKQKENQSFRNNSCLSEILIYNKDPRESRYLSKRKVKKIGKRIK